MMGLDISGTTGGAAMRRRIALDIVPALMLALAVGFIAAVAPIDLVERLVVRSGLPSLLSAAHPPLGFTARVAMVAGSAAVTLAAVWLLLRVVGGRVAADDAEATGRAPRQRSADRHPDAPARRPFSAREALSLASPEAPKPARERAPRPLEQRSIAELLATLEARLCTPGANDCADEPALDRRRG